jgi:D-threo-aldose 1-dehydrogenase
MSSSTGQAGLPRRPLGRTGLQLSIVSAGGWLGQVVDPAKLGTGNFGAVTDDRAAREAAAEAAVRRALSLGINYFDTAPMYMSGEAERLLGVGLRALTPAERQGLFVSSKVGAHPELPKGYDRDSILYSLERSLKKLYTNHLDIVYIHDPESDAHMDQMLGPGGAVETLEALKAQGVVRAFGLGVRIHRFLRRAVASGRFDAILPSYDYTLIRNSAGPLIDYAYEHGVGVVSASPYLAGLLAGINPELAAARRKNDYPEDLARARALWRWAAEHEVDLGALAVQYHLRNPHITTTLIGPRDAGEVEANIRHATTVLPEAIWAELEAFIAALGPYAPGGEAQ